jgi:hypothetical protein
MITNIKNLTETQNGSVLTNGRWKKTFLMTASGGAAFWLANFAISRTFIAAEYRSAMTISYYPMLLESLIGGLIIGLLVSTLLLRFYAWIPVKDPISKSLFLSFIVLVLATITIGGPSSYSATPDVFRYFFIGTMINIIRLLALGLVIGFVCKWHYMRIAGALVTPEPTEME